jgi:hypothetical protein
MLCQTKRLRIAGCGLRIKNTLSGPDFLLIFPALIRLLNTAKSAIGNLERNYVIIV